MQARIDLRDVLDMDYVLKKAGSLPLKVELKKTRIKGIGIYAKEPIRNGEVIALYQIKVFREKTYESPTNNVYTIGIYTPSGNESKVWVGDIVPESLKNPIKSENKEFYIPYWAYFSNEPSLGQVTNAYIDMNLEETYKTRKRIKEGDFVTYKLIATENIEPGEEIVWDYGSGYGKRNYISY